MVKNSIKINLYFFIFVAIPCHMPVYTATALMLSFPFFMKANLKKVSLVYPSSLSLSLCESYLLQLLCIIPIVELRVPCCDID